MAKGTKDPDEISKSMAVGFAYRIHKIYETSKRWFTDRNNGVKNDQVMPSYVTEDGNDVRFAGLTED